MNFRFVTVCIRLTLLVAVLYWFFPERTHHVLTVFLPALMRWAWFSLLDLSGRVT